MANVINGKVWSLDTVAGLVSSTQVCIHSIQVRFTTAAAGSCIITTANTADVIADFKTTAASTAVVWNLDIVRTMGDQVFNGIYKSLMVNVDTVYIQTAVSR